MKEDRLVHLKVNHDHKEGTRLLKKVQLDIEHERFEITKIKVNALR
jgi:hypothetical protein